MCCCDIKYKKISKMTSPNKDLQLYDKHPNVKNNGYLRSNIENGSNMDESMGVLLDTKDTNAPPAKPLIVNFGPRTSTRTSIVRSFSFSYIYHDSKIRNRFLLFALVFILFGGAIGAIVVTITHRCVTRKYNFFFELYSIWTQ